MRLNRNGFVVEQAAVIAARRGGPLGANKGYDA